MLKSPPVKHFTVLAIVLFLLSGKPAFAGESAHIAYISDVIVGELPYFTPDGDLIAVIKKFKKKQFIGLEIVGSAPKGLIALMIKQEKRYFRAVHFEILNGEKIPCPPSIYSESSSTKQPVVRNMGDDCVAQKK